MQYNAAPFLDAPEVCLFEDMLKKATAATSSWDVAHQDLGLADCEEHFKM